MHSSNKDAERHVMFMAAAGPAYVNASLPIWERRGFLGRLVRVDTRPTGRAAE